MHAILFSDMTTRIQEIFNNVKLKVDEYILTSGPVFLGNLVAAAAIFFVGKWIAGMAQRVITGLMSKANVDETLAKFLSRIAYAFMLCAVALSALSRLGVNTTSLTAILAAAGLAIGMALQGSLSNFASGVIIILFRPFKVGDFIEAAGTKGVVEEIHIFSTMLHTPDNVDIIVPNGAIVGGNITNYSSKPHRRIDLVVGCGYDDDLLAVKKFLEDLLLSDARVMRDPAPVVAVSELGDHCVNFVVRPWVRNTEYWQVRWDLIEQVKLGFDHNGFSIPFPQQDVHVYARETATDTTGTMPTGSSRLFTDSQAPQQPQDGLVRPRRAA